MAKLSKVVKTNRWNSKILASKDDRSEKRKKLNAGDVVKLFYLTKTRSKSITRLKNRCKITGRPRGYIGDFGMSRCLVRNLAWFGFLPGVKKV